MQGLPGLTTLTDFTEGRANKSKTQTDLRSVSAALEDTLMTHYLEFERYLIRRVGDQSTAEDVLQNFCIRVMQSEVQLRDEQSAIGWLYTVLRSVLVDHYRRDSVRKRGDARYTQEMKVQETDRTELDEVDGTCKCLRGLLPELRPEYAELLRRIDFLQEPRKQVGADMGISDQNLRVRLHRARLAIGVALKQHCGACCEMEYRDCFCERGCTNPEPAPL